MIAKPTPFFTSSCLVLVVDPSVSLFNLQNRTQTSRTVPNTSAVSNSLFFFSSLRFQQLNGRSGVHKAGPGSARYGSKAVFNGPVRKWKKKWVHVSPANTVKQSQSNGNNNGNSSVATSILLCRWTPLSSADSGSSAVDGEDEEQPPKRKFWYTQVAVLEEKQKRADAKQAGDEVKTDENDTNQSPDWLSTKSDNELNMNKDLNIETQHSSMGNLDLDLSLKGHDDS